MTDPSPGTDATAVNALLGYRLRRAYAAMMADFAEVFAPMGLRTSLLAALLLIESNPGIIASELGATLAIKRANMVPLLNELEAAGLIVREPAPDDRRATALRLSPKGQAKLPEIKRRLADHEARFASRMTAAEYALLMDLLGRLQEDAGEHGDQSPKG